jgi:lipopolysaccharide transport system ATP-binding protein
MSVAIRVENLGKNYVLAHHRVGRKYVALRDVIAEGFKSLFKSHEPKTTSEIFWALREISFQIPQGEAVGIIGRNGAGKSTLLKLLSRITEPTTGRIEIDGRVASLLEVGTGFHPELTGRENIFLNGAILGMGRLEIKRKFDEIVAFAEIEKFLDTPVKRYSSGMYMRLAFAVAAHLEPEILVIDEVLAVGDAKFQKKCLGKMSEVSKAGRTVLFVSHNMSAVQNLCTRGILLEGGLLTFDGPVADAIERYADASQDLSGMLWTRPSDMPINSVAFQTIQIKLEGQQPHLRLRCDFNLTGAPDSADALLAVDILDRSFTHLMQAMPRATPFLKLHAPEQTLSLEIELPPLIPGTYFADFWMGPHYMSTFDHIKSRISFEIVDPPAADRTFPYSTTRGFMAPICRIISP